MADELFYRAKHARTGDVIPKYLDGAYRLFYLKSYKKEAGASAENGWYRMDTTDLLHMSEEVRTKVQGGTGDVIFYRGEYHLFSCIFPEGSQLITHYVSEDGTLDHWRQIKEDTFGPDGVIYHLSDWRDPRILYREDLGEFWMLMAARRNAGHSLTGCVGLCVSKDLKHWEYREPFYAPMRFHGALECPDYFIMGQWEYLVFSSYTTLFGNYYVKRRIGQKNWEIPANHRLDSRAFYAAKTASDGQKRYLFGWNPEKEEDLFGFWPSKMKAKDYRTWDWGGNLVIHRLDQKENGDLKLSFPESREVFFQEKTENTYKPITQYIQYHGGSVMTEERQEQQMMLMQELPESYELEVTIVMKNAEDATIALQVTEEMKEGYYLVVEPKRGRLLFRSWLRMSEEGGKTFPYDVELEAPIDIPADGIYKCKILVEDSVGTAYVNDETALSFRMYDLAGRHLGLCAMGKVNFENIRLYTVGK
ncbi:MAG: hypothetical protein K6E48_07625 [Lachnospiraceae bacterium]|nr:hypothetical protein [Lachnospiraceae bacterium]